MQAQERKGGRILLGFYLNAPCYKFLAIRPIGKFQVITGIVQKHQSRHTKQSSGETRNTGVCDHIFP